SKIDEKLRLCDHAKVLVYGANDVHLQKRVEAYTAEHPHIKTISWGSARNNQVVVEEILTVESSTSIQLEFNKVSYKYSIPFVDSASVSNAVTCICVALHLGVDELILKERLHHLPTVEMRLEMMQGINNCSVINDSYVNDLTSLGVALENLEKQ